MMTDFSPRTYRTEVVITAAEFCSSVSRCFRTANCASLEVEVLLPGGDDVDLIAETTALVLQATYYCCHLSQWEGTKPPRTALPYGKTIGNLISWLIFWANTETVNYLTADSSKAF